ncbi:Uncharacterized protein QTN25_010853 [Entamoeba marina]
MLPTNTISGDPTKVNRVPMKQEMLDHLMQNDPLDGQLPPQFTTSMQTEMPSELTTSMQHSVMQDNGQSHQMQSELPSEIHQNMTSMSQLQAHAQHHGLELLSSIDLDDQNQQKNSYTSTIKSRKWISRDVVKDKDGVLYYCYVYEVKTKSGQTRPQKVYIKKSSSVRAREPKLPIAIKNEGTIPIGEKERKLTRQHAQLLEYINTHMDQVKNYNKFVVSKVLQDVKKENPDSKVSYGLVKKVLESQGLLPPKKTYYKVDQ